MTDAWSRLPKSFANDTWSPEARKAAAEARKRGAIGGPKLKKSNPTGFAPKELNDLHAQHQKALAPLLAERDKHEFQSPGFHGVQKRINSLMNQHQAESLGLQKKIIKTRG